MAPPLRNVFVKDLIQRIQQATAQIKYLAPELVGSDGTAGPFSLSILHDDRRKFRTSPAENTPFQRPRQQAREAVGRGNNGKARALELSSGRQPTEQSTLQSAPAHPVSHSQAP